MIGLKNPDSSFFEVLTQYDEDVADAESINKYVISLSITEEVGRIITGTVQMYDPFNVSLDRILCLGQKLKIKWGYKSPDMPIESAMALKDNPKEIMGPMSRGGLEVFVTSPSGSADSNGNIIYNCNFLGSEYFGGNQTKVYSRGTRGDAVRDALLNLGIKYKNQLINFHRQSEMLTQDTALIQWESHFRFIADMSFRYGCVFSIGQGPNGSVALFADYNTPEMEQFANLVGNSVGFSGILNYKHGVKNVISYSFQQMAGESAGDNVQIIYLGGKPTFRRFKAQTLEIQDYEINPEAIKQYIKDHPGTKNRASAVKELLQINKFQTLVDKKFFILKTYTTAPQGYGWTFNVHALGNPLYVAPMRIYFGEGFPAIAQQKTSFPSAADVSMMADAGIGSPYRGPKTSFWTRRVTHTIDSSGYHMDLDIADILTITGGSFVG